jgi:hypothetical protein
MVTVYWNHAVVCAAFICFSMRFLWSPLVGCCGNAVRFVTAFAAAGAPGPPRFSLSRCP